MHDAALVAILAKSNRGSRTSGIFSIAAGAVFTGLGLYHIVFEPDPPVIAMTLGAGLCLMGAGLFYIRNAKKK